MNGAATSHGLDQPAQADGELQQLRAELAELRALRVQLERELRDAGLRVAAFRAEKDFLCEKNRSLCEENRSLREKNHEFITFIAHAEETIANCHRELARSPWQRFKDLGHRFLKRMGLRP